MVQDLDLDLDQALALAQVSASRQCILVDSRH